MRVQGSENTKFFKVQTVPHNYFQLITHENIPCPVNTKFQCISTKIISGFPGNSTKKKTQTRTTTNPPELTREKDNKNKDK